MIQSIHATSTLFLKLFRRYFRRYFRHYTDTMQTLCRHYFDTMQTLFKLAALN
jgi:hypothetical protein